MARGGKGGLTALPLLSAFLIDGVDWAGAFVFALSGALVGVGRRFDLFGVLALGFLTAVAGGVFRDLLIGAVPPSAISDWRPLAISIVAGLIAFWRRRWLQTILNSVLVLDAARLGVFAVTGAAKALEHGLTPFMAAVLGMLSGIGGGISATS